MVEEDHREYERLIKPLEGRMLKVIWGVTGNPDEAEEALQEALAVLWRRWDRLCRHPHPEALIFRICINASYDVIRRNARHRNKLRAASEREARAPAGSGAVLATPEEAAHRGEQQAAVTDALGQLSRNQALAVVMRLMDGLPFEEVAEAIGCGTATARKHLERGRMRLRTLLTPFVLSLEKDALK